MLVKCDDFVFLWLKSVEIFGFDCDVGFFNVVFFVFCRKVDGDRIMMDVLNVVVYIVDVGKVKVD